MTKSELIDRLAAQFPQLVAKDAELAVKMILDAMAESLAKGERIEIRGFGSFGLNYRPPRTGRNPEVRREGAGAARSTSRTSRPARNCASGSTSRSSRNPSRVALSSRAAVPPARVTPPASCRITESSMQLLRWIVGVTLFLALLFLSLQNAELGDAQVLPSRGAGRRRSSSSC